MASGKDSAYAKKISPSFFSWSSLDIQNLSFPAGIRSYGVIYYHDWSQQLIKWLTSCIV